MSSLELENKDLKRKLEDKGIKTPELKSSSPERLSDDELDKRLREYEKSVEGGKRYPDGSPSNPNASLGPSKTAQNVPPNGPPNGASKQPDTVKLGPSGPNNTQPVNPAPGLVTVKLQNPNLAGAAKTTAKNGESTSADQAKAKVKTIQNYLPSGMFGRAVLLAGLDAPTGGQSQTNPHPVLLQLRDLGILPNKYRYDWKECTVTAAGYGDISSERAYIRTETLSCIGKDGKVLDVPIKGYIVGEDGKAGMRGRLVSKQGAALANGLLAGVVAGIGSGFEKSSSVQSVSPLGTTTSVNRAMR